MKNKKIISILSIFVFSIISFTNCNSNSNNSNDNIKHIGISQFVEHPALDSAKEGFIEALAEEGFEEGKNIQIDFQTSQADVPTSQSIATNFVREKKDLIFAIATPSAQAAKNATNEIPIVFTAVTDPVEAQLVESKNSPNCNVTGSSDFLDIEKSLDSIIQFLPNTKTIGVIYNTSEINSKIQVDNLKKLANKQNLEVVEIGITSVNEINQAVSTLCKKSDIIFTPTDNMVASSMPIIVETALKFKVPVIGSEEAHVENGAFFANSISYKDIGKSAGKMAAQILNGQSPDKMPVKYPDKTKLVVNQYSMTKLSLEIDFPEDALFIK